MQTSIFVQDVTVVDLAHLGGSQGDGWHASGDSFSVSFYMIGSLNDEKEQVVVDFSQVKKDVKRLFDQMLDHRTWMTELSYDALMALSPKNRPINTDGKERFFVYPTMHDDESVYDYACSLVEDEIKKIHTNVESVTFFLRFHPRLPEGIFNDKDVHRVFSYTHGLKSSSSHGCQNILHGHFSVAAAKFVCVKEGMEIADILSGSSRHSELYDSMHSALSYVIDLVISKDMRFNRFENMVGDTQERYVSQCGEFFEVNVPFADTTYVTFEGETTIENISQWFHNSVRERFEEKYPDFRDLLWERGYQLVTYVSEGFNKGSVNVSRV